MMSLFLLVAFPLALAAAEPSDATRIARVEHGIEPLVIDDAKHPLKLDLGDLMKALHDPGLSIAVIDDYRIVWAKGYGVIGADDPTPVNVHTLFQAGSISKPVAATAMLRMVEEGQLSLDQDVNAYLKTWKVPGDNYTKVAKVTLRRIASHTAGTTVHGFPGYEVGKAVPTIPQILDGLPPANTPAVRVDFTPGSKFRYSGGGTMIEQLVMTDVSGQTFPDLMQKSVLGKIGMSDSTFEQPLPPERATHAAYATYANDKPVPGKWHVYPEMAAAGLWTTPTDLAKFAIETALAANGKSAKVLSAEMTRERLTAQPATDDRTGLGFFLNPKTPGHFAHDGVDEGFQASLVMNAKTGKGVVIMANSDNGLLVAWDLMSSVAKEYEWPTTSEPRSLARRLVLIEQIKGADAALKAYAAAKSDPAQAKDIDDSVLNMVAFVTHQCGSNKDALKILERNAREYPNSAEAQETLGRALVEAHEPEKARRAFEAAIKIDPKNRDAVAELEKLESAKK
jgi:CubicO group peptidase (beta-lactamase class C family)